MTLMEELKNRLYMLDIIEECTSKSKLIEEHKQMIEEILIEKERFKHD